MTSTLYDAVSTYVLGAPGVGNITVGAAVPGARTPSAASIPDGTVCPCRSESGADGSTWEVGDYTWRTAGYWERTTIYESSAGGSAVPLGSDTVVFITPNKFNFGGGGGTPGGTSGQVQYNASGTFGGFTVGGDGTLNTSTGALTVTKTNGVAFGSFATVTPTGTPTGSKFLRDDNSWQAVSASPAGVSGQYQYNDGGSFGAFGRILFADTTFYVRTDGNNANDGLANTSGGAWATIQYACDYMAVVDANGFGVTIQVGDGTYAAASAGSFCVSVLYRPRNALYFYLSGNSGTPANVILDGASSGAYGILIGYNYDTAAQQQVIVDDIRGFTVKDAWSMVTMFTHSQTYLANMRSENNSRVYDIYAYSNVTGGGGIVVAGAHDHLVRGSQFSSITVSGSISFEVGATMATSVYRLDQTANATAQLVNYTNLTNSGIQYDIAAFCTLDTGGNLASIPGSAGTVDALGKAV